METKLMPDWYTHMMGDCVATIVEGETASKWILIENYHQVGKRILSEKSNLDRLFMNDSEIVRRVAKESKRPERLIYNCVQFARKYPELNLVPDGKNVSWRDIVHKYLPESREGQPQLDHTCHHVCEFHVKQEVSQKD